MGTIVEFFGSSVGSVAGSAAPLVVTFSTLLSPQPGIISPITVIASGNTKTRRSFETRIFCPFIRRRATDRRGLDANSEFVSRKKHTLASRVDASVKVLGRSFD